MKYDYGVFNCRECKKEFEGTVPHEEEHPLCPECNKLTAPN